MLKNFLFVCDHPRPAWLALLRSALGPLGSVEVSSEKAAPQQIAKDRYDLIILDTLEVNDPGEIVTHLRTGRPDAKILVLSSSPTWLRARHALLAGAVDYGLKTNQIEELRKKVENAMQMPAPH